MAKPPPAEDGVPLAPDGEPARLFMVQDDDSVVCDQRHAVCPWCSTLHSDYPAVYHCTPDRPYPSASYAVASCNNDACANCARFIVCAQCTSGEDSTPEGFVAPHRFSFTTKYSWLSSGLMRITREHKSRSDPNGIWFCGQPETVEYNPPRVTVDPAIPYDTDRYVDARCASCGYEIHNAQCGHS